jgi:hypothetical protein
MKNFVKSILYFSAFLGISLSFLTLIFTPSSDALTISDKDRKKIEDLCKKETNSNEEANACFDGYVLGLQDADKSICNQNYSGKAAKACSETGYNLGKSNSANTQDSTGEPSSDEQEQGYLDKCGKGEDAVLIKFNFGCNGAHDNPIYDLAFTLIRFLSVGVGLVVAASIIMAGIKYSTSEGNPEATMQAKKRIQNSLIALLVYIFAFAIVNYLVPGGFLT